MPPSAIVAQVRKTASRVIVEHTSPVPIEPHTSTEQQIPRSYRLLLLAHLSLRQGLQYAITNLAHELLDPFWRFYNYWLRGIVEFISFASSHKGVNTSCPVAST